jgi:16S rRNA U516 pseudouridylate synthase RsuA-like enzyme
LKKTAAKIPGTGPTKEKPAEGERLQRVVVVGGGVSRRKAGELILEGRVAVNGTTENSPGKRVDPHRDQVTLDGTRLRFDAARTEALYILL